MVVDNIKNYKLYEDIHSEFRNAFQFVKDFVECAKPDGKYEINENVYAIVTSYKTELGNCDFETHEQYLDGQFIFKGKEAINWAEKSKLETTKEYDRDNDFALHTGEIQTILKLQEGDFAIFFPEDAHTPKRAYNGVCEDVKKIIIKIKVN
ncbi:YhcH/YjgK/YiaL family protein [Clostridium sediminicola]|uniref:YhcH/YjgK/YiaL family protein n=1 Tax=Clostridium sediminicola TaxID=3114879 RepID=UPI0031F1E5C0